MSILNIIADSAKSDIFREFFRPGEATSTFASDITRRISAGYGLPATPSTDEANANLSVEQSEKLGQLEKLEKALSDTVAYMTDKHGEKAGIAMMAIIYKCIGEGEINEESLGRAFLGVTGLIDRNFGVEAGDSFMEHLNGNLNDSINAFFDNGKSEMFYAVTTKAGSPDSISVSGLSSALAEQVKASILEIIEQNRNNTEDREEKVSSYSPYTPAERRDSMLGLLTDNFI